MFEGMDLWGVIDTSILVVVGAFVFGFLLGLITKQKK
jgi:hypothetical protein